MNASNQMNQTEQTIVACMINYPNDSIQSVVDSNAVAEWFSGPHGHIFDAIMVLHATGTEITLPNIASKLKAAKQTLMGIVAELMQIEVVPEVNLKPALKKLAQAAALRSMSDLSEQIKYAIDQGNDTSSLVAELARRQAGVPDSLTIYGVNQLSREGQILLYFSKPEAKLSEKMLTQVISLATTNNIKKLSKINWAVLSGRKITIWRGDNQEAADHLYYLLVKAGAAGVRVVRSPSEQARGFGIQDAELSGWSAAQIFDYIRKNLHDPSTDAEEQEPVTMAPSYQPTEEEPLPDRTSAPYQCLGYDHNTYYYLPRGSNQVIPLRAEQHAESHLITIADLNFWEGSYPGTKGTNWRAAANAMIRYQERTGVYDPTRLRGRGAWEDVGRSVLHLGNLMYVDGRKMAPHELASKFIYEAAAAMEYDTPCTPLDTKGANKFVELCDKATWERPIYGRLLAGWCVIAPICGALGWRPHIHVTGASGTGKSSIMSNIVAPIVGKAALSVKGAATSAAGLRQSLGCDARPVIHDEFEGEGPEMLKLIQSVLELARGCSSDDDSGVIKGGADGKVKVYRTRSAFCFSSIGVNMTQASDISRISVLSLKKNDLWTKEKSQAHFDEITAMWNELMTEEYCCAFRARMVRLIPTIRKNAFTFARAAAAGTGAQRTGDQIGALLAGSFACFSDREVTPEAARKWIEEQDWSEYAIKEEQMDEQRCLAKILQTLIPAQGDKGGRYDLSVGELINIVCPPALAVGGAPIHAGISDVNADLVLKRHGVKVSPYDGTFSISNTHIAIEKMLEKTPWSKNWPQLLGRLPGNVKTGSIRFGACATKAVQLPLEMLG
jgi:putative DNA primase/helicase